MCERRWLFLLSLIVFSSVALFGAYAQVTISEENYQRLVLNLKEAKSLSLELETLRQERERLLAERQSLLDSMQNTLNERQALIDEKQKLLDENAKRIAELEALLTTASQSLKDAELEANSLELKSKLGLAGSISGWIAFFICLIIIIL